MRIICISDTHGEHEKVKVPNGDVLIHAGDCTDDIGQAALRRFLIWMQELPHKHKVLIAGNHDGAFEKWPALTKGMVAEIAPSITYLQDSGATLDGITFWGSPVTPEFFDWHFNRERGQPIRSHWDLIPNNVDVLVTHGPAKYNESNLDYSKYSKEHVGCLDLYEAVLRVRPSLHVFGHIHGGYGIDRLFHDDGTKTICINASSCDEKYRPVNAPIIIDL